jgi:hypothetical protein
MRRAALLLLAFSLPLLTFEGSGAQGRSFVGKKLPYPFTDSNGYTIDPKDYHGSVLVVFGGIPW